jgi:hypothetical protein
MVDDGIQTDAVDRNATVDSDQCFVANVVEPGDASVVFGSRLSDKEGAPIPLPYLREDLVEGLITWITRPKGDLCIVDPLIPVIEVQAKNV